MSEDKKAEVPTANQFDGNTRTTELNDLKNTRKLSKASMTRVLNAIESNRNMSAEELECRLGVLDSYYKLCFETQLRIERIEPENTGRNDIDELYISTKTKIKCALGHKRRESMNESFVSWPSPKPVSALPALDLPKFSGRYTDYKCFIASFNAMVHSNQSLCDTEKFCMFRQCLQGQAMESISAFPITDDNYPKAKARLAELYDNDCLIFLQHINDLFDIPKMSKSSQSSLRHIVDKVSAVYSAIKTLASHEQICDSLIIHSLMNKLDFQTKHQWEQSLDFKSLPKWDNCNEFLDRRAQHLQAAKISEFKSDSASTNQQPKHHNKSAITHTCVKGSQHNRTCDFCNQADHLIYGCLKFAELSASERYTKANDLKLCLNCLGKKHTTSKCKSRFSCKVCKKRHHSLLHFNHTNNANSTESQTSCSSIKRNAEEYSQVILATASILIRDGSGEYHLVRALLDNCSQVNFIRESIARKLRLPVTKRQVEIDGVNDSHTSTQFVTQTRIRSRINEFETALEFLITPTVSTYTPDRSLNPSKWNIPKNIDLADPEFNFVRPIDVLIGGELFFELLSVGQIKLGDGLPIIQKSILGWLVVGRTSVNYLKNQKIKSFCNTIAGATLDKMMERFWEIDEVENKAQKYTPEQQQCEEFYTKTVSTQSDGRIVARIPFKDNLDKLGSSYSIALRRFHGLEKRLAKEETLRAQYISFMREYESLGHMTPIEIFDMSQPHYFIPHHCVLKPTSTTTKLRVVFDASCKTDSGLSLNDLTMVGPTIQNELLISLIKFRTHSYCLTGDITKMYRQVLIHPTDRLYQLILWRENINQHIKVYTLNTVTYGTSSAPFLAVRSLHLAAKKCYNTLPTGANIIMSDFYVDDLLSGAESLSELYNIQKEVTIILKQSGFEITKWRSNHHEFLRSTQSHPKHLKIVDDCTTSTLGVIWNPITDEFNFSYQHKRQDNKCTKRTILSQSSSLFDPMGLLSPLIIRAKMMLQDMWLLKIEWDESVPQSIFTKWQNFIADLQSLYLIKIPRHIISKNAVRIEIHGFCDASIRAYGCVLYARSITQNGNIKSCIIVSKSRVAPIKVKTLPRLELCGAHLLSKLWTKIKHSFRFKPDGIYFWSDSQVVLHWLNLHSSKLSTFVGNRVAEIQELTRDISWLHVPSAQNPADYISRGVSAIDLMSSLWTQGPSFLQTSTEKWPSYSHGDPPAESLTEIKKNSLVCHQRQHPLLDVVYKHSNYNKILRIFGYVIRFIRIKCKKEHSNLTTFSLQELSAAKYLVLSLIQRHHFASEIHCLEIDRPVTGHLNSLTPFIDNSGPFTIVRVGGRLQNADIPESAKYPILLPNKDNFVTCLVRHYHRINYHAGPKSLVAILRDQFWIVNVRSIASKIVNTCLHCIKYRPKLLQEIMANLPSHRVTIARPFQRCGVDFCGPVFTYLNLRGKVPYKSYISVFVCFVTKAVHLEAVTDLSSNKFIEALKRLIGRRGLPEQIYCDNATNFAGACKQLQILREQFYNKENINCITSFCAQQSIEFKFIPPRAPHFGGLWEAAVKVAKGHLLRSIAHVRLTYEELSTVLIEIEAVMNSRPLCPMSTNPNDLTALTPGHFLIGTSLKAIPEPAKMDVDITHLQRWQRINALKNHFWQRWQSEYLQELRNRNKWKSPLKELSIGDMVIIHEDNTAPMNWPLGKVRNIIKGADGRIRVAEVQTSKGLYKRPIVKLALLPVN